MIIHDDDGETEKGKVVERKGSGPWGELRYGVVGWLRFKGS